MASSRSGNGCWTCRLRKKRCDEAKPVCGSCEFRDITCHGYGPKPHFLCSAEDQKKEIAKIQQGVSDSFKARRAFRRVSKKGPRLSQPRPIILATETTRDEAKDLTQAYEAKLSLESAPPASNSGSGAQIATTLSPSAPLSGTSRNFPAIQKEEEYPHTFLTDAYPAQNAEDLALIMNYIDNMFPLSYYFYQPTGQERGRGWLLSLILRSKPSYYITLALSILQQIRYVYDENVSREENLYEELDRYLSLGIAELQSQLDYLSSLSGHEHLVVGIGILACTVQLVSIEVFRQTKLYQGWKGDWEVHLNGAGSLLSIIGADLLNSSESSMAPITADENTPPGKPGDSSATLISLSEIAGLDLYTSTYVWVDIMRSACIGARSLEQDPFPYLAYLEEGRIRLDKLMGVKNWAMLSIRQISGLEAWRTEYQDRLDIPMLYRRASEIESHLDLGLEMNSKDLPSSKLDIEGQMVTEIYALSALIYLTIVVSESNLTPKIRLGVPKVLEKIKNLPPHLIMRVSWPFCVAGCMAVENEKDEFRTIVSNSLDKGHNPGTLLNSLDLIEEFWKIRGSSKLRPQSSGRSNSPWAIAMERLGTKVILL